MNFKLEKNHIDIEEIRAIKEPIIAIGIKNCDYNLNYLVSLIVYLLF